LRPSQRREVAKAAVCKHGVSVALVCRPRPHPLSGTTLPGRQVGEGVSPTLDVGNLYPECFHNSSQNGPPVVWEAGDLRPQIDAARPERRTVLLEYVAAV